MAKSRNAWFVTPVNAQVKLDEKIWTVTYSKVSNWWLFDWMTLWTPFFLHSYDSEVHFMGRLYQVLVENKSLQRNQLSILRSPNRSRFLELLNNKWVNIQINIFKKTLSGGQSGLMDNRSTNSGLGVKSTGKVEFIYLIHIFQSDRAFHDLNLEDRLTALDVFVHFEGVKSALIGYKEGRKKTVPFAIDGLLILAAFEEVQFHQLLNQNWYVDFMEMNQTNFIGLFKREV